MKIVKELFENKNVRNVIKKGRCLIATIDDERVAIKEKNCNNVKEIYEYLESRNYNYYPKIIIDNKNYNVYEYIEDINCPIEQKAYDMMNLLALLHNKTTFYKEMDIDEYKKIYEDTLYKINNTYNFYLNFLDKVETQIYPSPSEYLILRNISKIFESLNYSNKLINEWYDFVKNSAKKRVVVLYNNIDINHVIRNKDLYLINWDKTKLGTPIYDIYNFYYKYANIFDFKELFNYYEERYSLLEEEKKLLYCFISIPDILIFKEVELENCKNAKKIIDKVYKTELIVSNL